MSDTQVFKVAPSRRLVVATVAGNALEFYDFLAYIFFATYIGKTFFPTGSEVTSLLVSLAVFGVGFVARPLGGLLIGAFADRVGRRPAMILTISLITLGTLSLALTPSYESIGIAAPIIVVFCRLVQGLALGGEVGPSTAYLLEIAPEGKRGLYTSWQLASQGIAYIFGGLIAMIVTSMLSIEQLTIWGWRIPFSLGLLLVPVAIYLRKNMPETLELHKAKNNTSKPSLAPYVPLIGLAILLVLGVTVSTYVANYMTTYAITTLHFSPTISVAATLVLGLATFTFALLGGHLSDRYGRKPLMLYPRILLVVVTYPAFMLLVNFPSPAVLYTVTFLIASLTGLSGAPTLALIPELLPQHIRATGLSIAYAVGVSLFGGTTPFIVAWLIKVSGDPLAPGWYVAITSLITILAIWLLPESRNKALEK